MWVCLVGGQGRNEEAAEGVFKVSTKHTQSTRRPSSATARRLRRMVLVPQEEEEHEEEERSTAVLRPEKMGRRERQRGVFHRKKCGGALFRFREGGRNFVKFGALSAD